MKKYLNVNTICLALVLCLGGFSLIPKSGPKPDTPDVPQPEVVVPLVEQVKQDLAGDPDKAGQYAGLYEAAALIAKKTEEKPQDFFKRVPAVLKVLELSDPELSKTVEKHLKPFEGLKEWDEKSREAFSKAVLELAEACKEAM